MISMLKSITRLCFLSGARRDKDGYLWVTGRIDDMLNISGHLLSTAEVRDCKILTHSYKIYLSGTLAINTYSNQNPTKHMG